MKKLASAIFLLFLLYGTASPQSCLPEGIIFTTQEQIDNFQTNFPGCTEIEGDVEITGNYITNLNGLSVLTAFWGELRIWNNAALTSLTGLNNVTSIEGDLQIGYNPGLTSLTGLENVTLIENKFYIGNNAALTSLTGLNNITSIGLWLTIRNNDALTNLMGLDNVTSIAGNLYIEDNDALTSLTGLDNVTSIGGYLWIDDSDALTSLSGLDNIDAASIVNISIIGNTSLSACEAQSICNYLASPNGTVIINYNAPGCNNPTEVANACGVTLPCLPYGNYYFFTQTEIDNFQINYPDCYELMGTVMISGDSIFNLNGLSVVTSIEGYLRIYLNEALTNLTGLNHLTSIGEDLQISYNWAMASLTGLENLTSIGNYLEIYDNDALISLTGLDNIDAGSIDGLFIFSNSSLSTCEVESICDYLANPNGTIQIYNNASGCNSQSQVLAACESVSVESISPEEKISIFPNPANRQLTICSKAGTTIEEVIIYNQTGQKVLLEKPENNTIDISQLHPGMYIIEVVYGQRSEATSASGGSPNQKTSACGGFL